MFPLKVVLIGCGEDLLPPIREVLRERGANVEADYPDVRTVLERLRSGFDWTGVAATEDAGGHFTTTIYDSYGRVAATENALGNFTTTIYDTEGRVAATEDARGNFTTFLKLADAAQITPTLKTLPSITLFAPDDAAFAKLAPGIVDGWLNTDDKDGLQRLMLYHVINLKLTGDMIMGHYSAIQTIAGSSVQLDGNQGDGHVHVDAAVVTQPEIPATNGTIFVIDRVLAPR